MNYIDRVKAFKNKLEQKSKPLIGTFIKTNAVSNLEIIASTGMDFIIIDAEHAPFSRSDIDLLQLAARASAIPALVRVDDINSSKILSALDSGACGVIVPHIDSKEKAEKLVSLCLYNGSRGFSNSPRAGEYGNLKPWEHILKADKETLIIAMIEDEQACEKIDEILSVKGLSGIFIGRGDLMVSLNDRSEDSYKTNQYIQKIILSSKNHKKPIFIVPNSKNELNDFFEIGVCGFVCGSDQSLLKNGILQLFENIS
ncbi:TPA: HpcH/HpaI aldolase/citrate lyase family protein [Acinetobacter baumannii]